MVKEEWITSKFQKVLPNSNWSKSTTKTRKLQGGFRHCFFTETAFNSFIFFAQIFHLSPHDIFKCTGESFLVVKHFFCCWALRQKFNVVSWGVEEAPVTKRNDPNDFQRGRSMAPGSRSRWVQLVERRSVTDDFWTSTAARSTLLSALSTSVRCF